MEDKTGLHCFRAKRTGLVETSNVNVMTSGNQTCTKRYQLPLCPTAAKRFNNEENPHQSTLGRRPSGIRKVEVFVSSSGRGPPRCP